MKPTVAAPTPTCREFLGTERGCCPEPPVTVDPDGRVFCRRHATERGL